MTPFFRTRCNCLLLVVATQPHCKTNLSSADHSVKEFGFISVECEVRYKGNWAPTFDCHPRGHDVIKNITNNRATYKQVVFVSPQRHGQTIRCTTSFTSQLPNISPSSSSTTDLGEPPNNSYTWTSPTIRVASANSG